MAYRAVGMTDVGLVRKENQDNFLVLAPQMVYAVADGMGGHAGGKQASAIAIEVLRQELEGARVLPKGAVEAALSAANERILREAKAQHLDGMGTTLVLAMYDKSLWQIVHIGDSRAYLINKAQIKPITKDHSLVEELLAQGSITEDEARVHPHRNILTRALGSYEDLMPEWNEVKVRKGEYLLLCTDGLYNMLEAEEIQTLVAAPGMALEAKTKTLVEAANKRGGLDNITVILAAEEDGL